MNLRNNALRELLWASQTGQARLRGSLKSGISPGLRFLLRVQRSELESLELDIRELACQRGLRLADTDPALLGLLSARLLPGGDRDRRIARRLLRSHSRCLDREGFDADPDRGVALLRLRLRDLRKDHMSQLQRFLGEPGSPSSRSQ